MKMYITFDPLQSLRKVILKPVQSNQVLHIVWISGKWQTAWKALIKSIKTIPSKTNMNKHLTTVAKKKTIF